METQAWKQYIPEFREKTQQFYDGSMSQKDYKGFSGFYGTIYNCMEIPFMI